MAATDRQEDQHYTPRWTIVPLSAGPDEIPAATIEGKLYYHIGRAFLWFTAAFIAVSMYENIMDLLP